jgi:uncharacterized protein (DUF1697 family)
VAKSVVWIALLRGVNIGPRKRIAMAELRALVDELGFGPSKTYIASGNVLFRAPKAGRAQLARRLERGVRAEFGVDTLIVLRTLDELRALLAAHPFGSDVSHTYVTFLDARPTAGAVSKLDPAAVEPDRFEVRGSDVYLSYPNLVTGARLTGALLERTLGVPGTARNWRTVTKLVELGSTLERVSTH